jgi:hypothetical protein
MSRYQLLAGKHVQDEERVNVVNGKEVKRIIAAEYWAHHPIHGSKFSIVDSSRAVVAARDVAGKVVSVEKHGDVDLCEKFNQPGFSEKFRKLQEPEQLAQDMNNEDLLRFAKVAIAKGLITANDLGKASDPTSTAATGVEGGHGLSTVQQTAQPNVTKPEQDPLMVASLKRDLAAVNNSKTPLVGLLKMAEDEEIDITACKNDKQEWKEAEVRRVLKAALEARLK